MDELNRGTVIAAVNCDNRKHLQTDREKSARCILSGGIREDSGCKQVSQIGIFAENLSK